MKICFSFEKEAKGKAVPSRKTFRTISKKFRIEQANQSLPFSITIILLHNNNIVYRTYVVHITGTIEQHKSQPAVLESSV